MLAEMLEAKARCSVVSESRCLLPQWHMHFAVSEEVVWGVSYQP